MPAISIYFGGIFTFSHLFQRRSVDVAVIEVTPGGLLLHEVAPGWTAEDVQEITEPRLLVDSGLREMEL